MASSSSISSNSETATIRVRAQISRQTVAQHIAVRLLSLDHLSQIFSQNVGKGTAVFDQLVVSAHFRDASI
jgi:hypothetical protein